MRTLNFVVVTGLLACSGATLGCGSDDPPTATLRAQLEATPTLTLTTVPLPSDVYGGPGTDGPDGNLWVLGNDLRSGEHVRVLMQVTPEGAITYFPTPVDLYALTTGADGTMWACGQSGAVAQVSTSGAITVIPNLETETNLYWITGDAEGYAWYSDYGRDRLIRVSAEGTFRKFPLPKHSNPTEIVAGNNNTVWAGDTVGKLHRVNARGRTEHVPPSTTSANGSLGDMVFGPMGDIWFTQPAHGQVARVTPGGSFEEYATPSPSYPTSMALGSDGNIWVANGGGDMLIRVTPSGSMTEFAFPSPLPGYPVTTLDGEMWIVSSRAIAHFDPNDLR